MATIEEIKQQYPHLNGLDDDQVVGALHKAFYADLPRELVAKSLGVKPQPVIDKNAPGQLRSGFNRSFAEVPSLAAGSAAYVADVVGANETRDKLLDYAKKSNEEVQAAHQGDAASITDAWDGKTSWPDFLKNATGYVAGQALQGIATGGLGALGGKMLATQGIKTAAERTAAEFIAKGATQEVATAAAASAAKNYAAKMAVRGAVVGAGGQNLNMELGSIYPDAVDEAGGANNLTGGDKFRVGASALAAAGVDTAAEAITANRVFRGSQVGQGAAKPPTVLGSEMLGRAVREVPAGMARESGTEGVQTVLEHYGAGQPIADEKGTRDIVDSMGVGAVGGILGGAGASFRSRKVEEVGPLSRAANAEPSLQIGNTPDPYLSFADGTVARKSEIDTYIASLPPEQQPAARAKAMGLAPQPATPAQAMGIDPAAGPLSSAAAIAVDTGTTQEIQRNQASEADQAAYDQEVAAQEQQAQQQDSAINPITSGPIAEAAMSPEDKRAILFSNQPVTDGGNRYTGTQDGDILNGLGKPYATRMAAQRRVTMEGKDWMVAPVFDGFVARRKDATHGTTDATAAVDQGADAGAGYQPTGSGTDSLAEPVPGTDRAGSLPGAPDGRGEPDHAVVDAGDGPASVAEASHVQDPTPAAQPAPAQATGTTPPAVAGDATTTEGLPGAGTAAVEAAGITPTIDQAAHEAATSPKNNLPQPTDGQKEAGNYPKGHVNLNGLDLSIENPAGSVRSGVDKDGNLWSNTLQHHYGYIKGTIGNDKDHVDLFVKPGTPLDYSGNVYVVNQIHPHNGKFDEHKVVVGAKTGMEARRIYHANYAKDWKGFQSMTAMPFDEFKTWVKDGQKNQPLSPEQQVSPPQGSNHGTQAAKTIEAEEKRPQAPAATGVATEFVKIKDIDGRNRYVRQSDLDGDKPLIRMFTKDGKNDGRIHRENLDPTGEKQAADNAANASNPFFDVITNKQGGAFKTDMAAKRELKIRGLQDSHEVAPAADVSAGATGFVVRKKEAQAPAAPVVKKLGVKAKIDQAKQARADYFTPGNIVQGYSGYDEVLSYTPSKGDGSGWNVKVRAVVQQDGKWVPDPKDNRERNHSTQPDARELTKGPVEKAKQVEVVAAPEVVTEATPKVGRFESLSVPNATTQWLGFDGKKTVRADLQALAQRHPEYYESAADVKRDIEFVLDKPDGWYIHKGSRVVLFRERIGNNAIPQARIEVEADADSMMVRSVYIGNKRQIAKKMGDKRKVLSGFELGGQSPDSLTVVEYLKILDDGSSRPALPSGSVPEADASVVQTGQEIKPEPTQDSAQPAVKPAKPEPTPSVPAKSGESDSLFSRSTDTVHPGGQPVARVQALVNAIIARWKNAPKVVVVQSLDDPRVPEIHRKNARLLKFDESGNLVKPPDGFFDKDTGTVYLIADKLAGDIDVVRVLMHESLGHYGLRGQYGAELGTILDRIAVLNAAKVRNAAKRLGLDFEKPSERRLATEEVLAYMAQETPEMGWVKRTVAAVRAWLRQHIPGFGKMQLSDNELIRDYIIPARQFVEDGSSQGRKSVASEAGTPFSRNLGDALTSGMNAAVSKRKTSIAGEASSYTKIATDKLNETFSHPGKLNWWHKSFGTMNNLAERSPEFKPVFKAAQDFIDDTSYYATEAADMAPHILPKLEKWADLTKSPITAADNKAVSAPIFEGTLSWSRDESGKPVRMDDLEASYAKLDDDAKAQMLLKKSIVTENELKRWKASPLDIYTGAVRNRFETAFLTAGVVWTDSELKSQFSLTPEQIKLYREFRSTVDKSLDNLAKADLLRFGGKDVAMLSDQVMDAKDADEAAVMLRDYLHSQRDLMPERADELTATASGMMDRADKVNKLKAQGYAPLSRFGKYTVDVVVNGERQYFSLFETARDANKMAAKMRMAYGAAAVGQGTLSESEFKLFAGVTPESLELFGNMLGLDSTGDAESDKAFQTYLKLTKTNRSAMRRMIHRKGIAGFSEDAGRVLASFVYSNARQTSAALHMGTLGEAVNNIPKNQGELKDAAIALADYIKNPQEEAQAIRGLLFAQYLGGSLSSAFVNMTQPFAVTFPWLSQFGGAKQSGAQLLRAMKDMAAKGTVWAPDLAKALKHAEENGIVSPQEVHQLMAQARGAGTLKSGDGTRTGDAMAAASNAISKLSLGWGKVFGMAEQLNRRSTFIAAYRVAQAQNMKDPAGFAERAVNETQFIYSKANKMKFGRGAIGGTLMTFKTYSIAYLELLSRMATQGGPEGKKAVVLALAVMMLMGGSGGLPFMEDITDLVDGLLQRLGYNVSTKKAKQQFLEDLFGKTGADFIDRGVSGLPGMPLDVTGRLGMGNVIPGTGLFQSKSSHASDLGELVGPAGDLAKRAFDASGKLLGGDVGGAALAMSPVAVRNAAKGVDMASTGMYRDAKGYKVLDTTMLEAALKSIGFQPETVANVQDSNYINQKAKNFYVQTASEIQSEWAKGIFEKDQDQINAARARMQDWNEKNPDQRMKVNMPAVLKRVMEMRKPKDQRVADTAPKAMRAQMRRELAQAHADAM